MTILIAADSFKDALNAPAVCRALATGWRFGAPTHIIRQFPLGDGGEGTASLLAKYTEGREESQEAEDPLGRSIQASFGLSQDRKTAFLDMAAASGLELLRQEERNPLQTHTRGTGILIRHLHRLGVETLYLGLGGSATHDVGMGMAEVLGFRFLDEHQNPIAPSGANLIKVSTIVAPSMIPCPRKVLVLTDVDTPLTGETGAAFTFAQQKGADGSAIQQLEQGTKRFATLLEHKFGKAIDSTPGAGAAGGLGAGAMAFLGGNLIPGARFLMEQSGFLKALPDADLVITGEGRLDATSFSGKLVSRIVAVAKEHDVPVIAFCGELGLPPSAWKKFGLTSAFSIIDKLMPLKESLDRTHKLLEQTATSVALLFSTS